MVDALIEHNPGPYARAQRGVEDMGITRSSTPDGFCKRRGIAVVVNARWNPEDTLDLDGERKVLPARQVRGIDDNAGPRVKGTR
jgi:hypothetical protein